MRQPCCSIPHCDAATKQGHFMCAAHWSGLPATLQQEIVAHIADENWRGLREAKVTAITLILRKESALRADLADVEEDDQISDPGRVARLRDEMTAATNTACTAEGGHHGI